MERSAISTTRYLLLTATTLGVIHTAHADLVKTATGDCYITSSTPLDGGYHDPVKNHYWKYVPCDGDEAKAHAKNDKEKPKQKREERKKPAVKLTSSFKGIVSSIRKKLEVCLPFTLGSCSRAPDTVFVSWLPDNDSRSGAASRPTTDGQASDMSLKRSAATLFPNMVKNDQYGRPFINFEKTASVCQALRNDPRYVTQSGELSKRPLRKSILSNYNTWKELMTICHELIHLGECASCLDPIGSEREAFEYEIAAARNASRFAGADMVPMFAQYELDRGAYVYYLGCRQSGANVNCVYQCQKAGYPEFSCQSAGSIYGPFNTSTIGAAHEGPNGKPVSLGTLTPAEPETKALPKIEQPASESRE
jgi:hypothetical protein